MRRRLGFLFWVGCVTAPAVAQPPCTVSPFADSGGTAENVLGINNGFEGTYCQHLDLTGVLGDATCHQDGLYFVLGTTHGLTRTAAQGPQWRAGWGFRPDLGPFPGDPLAGQMDVDVGSVPGFPAYQEYDPELAHELLQEAGWVQDDTGVFVCTGWQGNDSQAIPADVGPGPVHDIFATFDGGGLFERVQDFPGFENYRSMMAGITIAPIGTSLQGENVVPPQANPFIGTAATWRNGNSWQIAHRNNVSSPTGVAVRQGSLGETGPLLLNLPPGSSGQATYFPSDPGEFSTLLDRGEIYVEVSDVSGPQIRGQLLPAGQFHLRGFDYSVGVGLSHPGTTNCYFEHHTGPGDRIVTFDGVAEDLRTFSNGTVPRADEFEGQPGRSRWKHETLVTAAFGPAELFPAGQLEPGTGTPLTDGCIVIGGENRLDAPFYSEVFESEVQAFSGDTPVLGNYTLRDWDSGWVSLERWGTFYDWEFENAAGSGIDRIELKLDTFGSIFADGFESGDTAAWTSSVPRTQSSPPASFRLGALESVLD